VTDPAKDRRRYLPAPGADLWVFAYGSLMWDPGFPYLASEPGLLRGYHRRCCIASTVYRGTPEQPGLVLGLDHGGSCRGLLFRVAAAAAPAVVDYLWAREMVTEVYRPRRLTVVTAGEAWPALAFVVDRAHQQYCAGLCHQEVVTRIRAAAGQRGPNLDYIRHTLAHLRRLGIVDQGIEALARDLMIERN